MAPGRRGGKPARRWVALRPASRRGAGLAGPRLDPDVEVQHVFALAELGVEREGRVVAAVGSDRDDSGAALGGDLAQALDRGGPDAPPPVPRGGGEIVGVRLAPRPLECVEFVSDGTA